jgi:C4-dicarboxylate-specific signal transduction histidine kinase
MYTAQIRCMSLTAGLLLTGCSSLSTNNYAIMHEALKEETAQAQRTAVSLHAEVQTLQAQLGASRAAHARTQGELRDSERRLIEAQRIAELKQDELAKAKEAREQGEKTGDQVKLRVADDREQKRINMLETSIKRLTKEVATLNTTLRDSAARPKPAAAPPNEPDGTLPPAQMKPSHNLIVRAGDTLFSIARLYDVALADLKSLNRLATDRILVGQVLIVPEP